MLNSIPFKTELSEEKSKYCNKLKIISTAKNQKLDPLTKGL